MPLRLDARAPGFADAFRRFVDAPRGAEVEVDAAVAEIVADVRQRGDAAVIAYTERFDRIRLATNQLRIGAEEIEGAAASCAPGALAALDRAALRIEAYHRRQLPRDWRFGDEDGLELGQRWRPLSAVGIYVPGGRAAYPSSVLMNAVPARVAEVARIAMVVPAPDGALNPLVLAAARRAGVTEIYRIGGAQAVAALAWGTTTIPRVDKIVGPGNAYVAAAKRHVFGRVGIDTIAGPSEVLVVADGANDPAWIAADLLAQAEHDETAQSVLIADDDGFIDAVLAAVDRQVARLPRVAIARASWERHGAVIRVAALDDAVALIDAIAPEHLELAIAEPEALADRVSHAGAIFLGRHAPEAIGDYVAGPSHVLPTARAARFASGLSVLDFMKRTSLIGCDASGLARIGPTAIALAEAEGLDAHALSVAIRLDRRD